MFLFTLAEESAGTLNRKGINVTQAQGKRGLATNRLALSIAILGAVAGWGVGAYSALDSIDLRKQLQGQATALQDYQAQYLSHRKAAEDGARENARLQEQLSALRTQVEQQSASNRKTEAELTKAREKLAEAQPLLQQQAVGSAPALLSVTPLPTKQDVIAAQEALTQLRFGTLEADGAMGPSTRQAIEEFQRVVGLPVTGELQPLTLTTLMRSAKVMAAQNERNEEPL